MKYQRLIGLSGKAGSGKDTVASFLQSFYTGFWRLDNPYFKTACIDSVKAGIAPYIIRSAAKGVSLRRKSFAHKLKEVCSILTGISVNDFNDPLVKSSLLPEGFGSDRLGKDRITARELLQVVGTEAIRNNLNKDIWVNALFSEWEKVPDNNGWVVTDVRFENEVRSINERGGVVIRVDRPGIESGDHTSETALDQYDFKFRVNNNGTLSDLYDSVLNFAQMHLIKK